MSALILLWTSNAIQAAILWRSFRASTIRRYPYFYTYIASTFASIVLPVIYLTDRPSYNRWYWPVQFATLVFGCGVILEIFQHVLSPYPGAARFGKIATFLAFGALFCGAAIYLIFHREGNFVTTGVELERNVRALQAVFLFVLLAIIFGYRIPIGRNVLGMMIGYGGYIGISLVSRAVEAYAAAWLRLVWIYVQPLSFQVSLLIWLVAMWSYHPNPAPNAAIPVEEDYELFAWRTRAALHSARAYLGRVTRL
jgi:hypothetical protein